MKQNIQIDLVSIHTACNSIFINTVYPLREMGFRRLQSHLYQCLHSLIKHITCIYQVKHKKKFRWNLFYKKKIFSFFQEWKSKLRINLFQNIFPKYQSLMHMVIANYNISFFYYLSKYQSILKYCFEISVFNVNSQKRIIPYTEKLCVMNQLYHRDDRCQMKHKK